MAGPTRKSTAREGKILKGVDGKLRHLYTWDLGKGVGLMCRKCGMPKPRLGTDETMCPGRTLATPQDTRSAQGDALPAYLLSIAWVRQLKELSIHMDPAFIQANKAASLAPLARFGVDRAVLLFSEMRQNAQQVYEVIDASANAYAHHLACCLFTVKLVNDVKLDPMSNAVLSSVATIREAQGSEVVGRFPMRECQNMAAKMIREAKRLGYYGGRASNLSPS